MEGRALRAGTGDGQVRPGFGRCSPVSPPSPSLWLAPLVTFSPVPFSSRLVSSRHDHLRRPSRYCVRACVA